MTLFAFMRQSLINLGRKDDMNKHGGYHGESDVIDYSININPLGLPESIRETVMASIDDMIKYPDISGAGARKAIGEYENIDPSRLIMGNGASELIYLFARAIRPEKVLIIQPTFNEYERAFRLVGSRIEVFKLSSEDGFHMDIEYFEKTLEGYRPDVVVLCNPNNPTGKFLPLEELKVLVDLMKQYESFLFIDESFIGFTGQSSIVEHVDCTRVFSLRSMTKYYAVPGLRIGYSISHEQVVRKLEAYKEPWTMNGLALQAVPAMIHDSTFHEQVSQWVITEHKWMYQALDKIQKLHVYPSETNFFLCKLHGISGHKLNVKLESQGAHVRVCDDFIGLDEGYIRIALRLHGENSRLIELLQENL